jgi:hypothetical protein
MPAKGSSEVNAAQATVAVQANSISALSIDSLDYSNTLNTGLTGTPSLSTYLDDSYKFADGNITFQIKDGASVTYAFTGNNLTDNNTDGKTITGTVNSLDNARAVWQALTSHMAGSIQTDESGQPLQDSYILIKNGSYLQIGTEKLVFENSTDDLKLDNFSQTEALNTTIRNALKLETGQTLDCQIKALLKQGSQIAVGSQMVTLNDTITVTITGISLENGLSNALSTLRDASGAYNVALALIGSFDSLVAAVDASNGVTVEFNVISSN